ncbi:MAG: CDP-diacylglycerol--glycerol-3-phosphate 3-phosphatidyltransferase [Oscillospiraceae bacterium]|nr:CDP-diacylglycerol--glycerol-3-phosphate 3-phosphatidyltransferase [Oscillospiraceae bacterium]
MRKKFMNLPNKITLIRVCFIPIILLFLLCKNIPNRYFVALIFFLAASYTDYLDGYLARKSGLITNFGKFLDPLADKILIISILVCFVELGLVYAIAVILIIFREFMVTSLRLIAAERGKIIPANCYGKIKTISQMLSIFLIMLSQGLQEILLRYNLLGHICIDFITKISNIIFYISAILTVFSGVLYIYFNKNYIK